MNGAHLHLIVNHVSLFALVFGTLTFIASIVRRSAELRVLAVSLFLVTGIFAWVAVETGEKAEHVVKEMDAESKPQIEAHEQAADWALRSGILVAALAVANEWAARRKPRWSKALQWTLLVFAIHGCTVFAVTALQGGKIRHSEVRE
jgi:uncharacterized membrane protein